MMYKSMGTVDTPQNEDDELEPKKKSPFADALKDLGTGVKEYGAAQAAQNASDEESNKRIADAIKARRAARMAKFRGGME